MGRRGFVRMGDCILFPSLCRLLSVSLLGLGLGLEVFVALSLVQKAGSNVLFVVLVSFVSRKYYCVIFPCPL